jgi:hypothetical protein
MPFARIAAGKQTGQRVAFFFDQQMFQAAILHPVAQLFGLGLGSVDFGLEEVNLGGYFLYFSSCLIVFLSL